MLERGGKGRGGEEMVRSLAGTFFGFLLFFLLFFLLLLFFPFLFLFGTIEYETHCSSCPCKSG